MCSFASWPKWRLVAIPPITRPTATTACYFSFDCVRPRIVARMMTPGEYCYPVFAYIYIYIYTRTPPRACGAVFLFLCLSCLSHSRCGCGGLSTLVSRVRPCNFAPVGGGGRRHSFLLLRRPDCECCLFLLPAATLLSFLALCEASSALPDCVLGCWRRQEATKRRATSPLPPPHLTDVILPFCYILLFNTLSGMDSSIFFFFSPIF